MIHVNVLRSATQFDFKIATSHLIQSPHPRSKPQLGTNSGWRPHTGKGSLVHAFTHCCSFHFLLCLSSITGVLGISEQHQMKRTNVFYIMDAAVIWLLTSSVQQFFNAPSPKGHMCGFFTGPRPLSWAVHFLTS